MENITDELSLLNNELNSVDLLLQDINKNKNDIKKRIENTINKLKIYKHPTFDNKFNIMYSRNILIQLKINFHDGHKIKIYETGHNYWDIVSNLLELFNWIKENPYTISELEFKPLKI